MDKSMNSDPQTLAKESGATDLLALAKEFGARVDDSMVGNVVAMFEDELETFVERIRAQERERCAVDAARYRWLRDEKNGDGYTTPMYAGEELDAAIDAAIRNGKDGG